MSIILNIILFVLILGVIVCVHEFGHFILAKMNGVYVYEFSIGMGPRIWGFKKGETDYNIRLIPIGGFCALAGEDLDDDDAKKIPKNKRLQAKKAWQRFSWKRAPLFPRRPAVRVWAVIWVFWHMTRRQSLRRTVTLSVVWDMFLPKSISPIRLLQQLLLSPAISPIRQSWTKEVFTHESKRFCF